MDEIEHARLMKNLNVLATHIMDVNVQNALKAVIAALDGLHDRILEMQTDEEDE